MVCIRRWDRGLLVVGSCRSTSVCDGLLQRLRISNQQTKGQAMTEYKKLLPLLVEAAGLPARPPRGRHYGLKAVHADFESSHGFIWAFPGGRSTSPKKPRRGGPCPSFDGDGLCVALDAVGAAQGGHVLSTV